MGGREHWALDAARGGSGACAAPRQQPRACGINQRFVWCADRGAFRRKTRQGDAGSSAWDPHRLRCTVSPHLH